MEIKKCTSCNTLLLARIEFGSRINECMFPRCSLFTQQLLKKNVHGGIVDSLNIFDNQLGRNLEEGYSFGRLLALIQDEGKSSCLSILLLSHAPAFLLASLKSSR